MKIGILMHSVRFEADKIAEKVVRKTVRSLYKAAGSLHTAAQRSIRESPNPSKPGKPPHTRGKNKLKNAVRFKVDEANLTAQVGVTEELGTKPSLARIASLHEYGGQKPYSPFVFRVGRGGPIELIAPAPSGHRGRRRRLKFKDSFRFAKLETEAQARRANTLAAGFFGAPKSTADYPERSFLRSTMTRVLPKIINQFFNH